jgi:hypothetical protein
MNPSARDVRYGHRGGRWVPEATRRAPSPREARQRARKNVCGRCHHRVARTVAAYWDSIYRLCPTCCLALAAELDATRSWPDPGPNQSVSSRNPSRRIG